MQRLVFARRMIVALVLVLVLLAVLVPTSLAGGPPPPSGGPSPQGAAPDQVAAYPMGTVYVVRPGDTLAGIAARFHTTTWAIAAANGLVNPNYIRVGQKLIIPTGSAAYVIPKGYPAAASGKASYSQVPSQYGQVPPTYGTQYPGTWHVVCRGETLSGIAARYGTFPIVIAVANGLPNPNVIYAGQRLWIPKV